MSLPAVELFSTSILSNHKIRYRHERFTVVLTIKKIPFIYHDLASDEDAKSRWRRKAKDPQIPGLLVNNEWRGSFDDFEEAVEFGELELFLGVEKSVPQPAAAAQVHDAQKATSAKDPSLFPTMNFAPEGSGKRAEPTADEFIASLGLADDSVTEDDVDALLADLAALGPAKPEPEQPTKRYVPSPEALIKPLRLARMGSSSLKANGSPSSLLSIPSPKSPSLARYLTSQRSSKALAAEAAALTSNRKTSGALLREAVSKGKALEEAMQESKMKDVVANEDIDELFASLGLKDVDLADDELEAFLEDGAIPDDLTSGGSRLKRSATLADKARDEVAAREVAQNAREKGYGKSISIHSKLSSSLGTLDESPMIDEPASKQRESQTAKGDEAASMVKSPSYALSNSSVIGDTSVIEHVEEPLAEDTGPTNAESQAGGKEEPKSELASERGTAEDVEAVEAELILSATDTDAKDQEAEGSISEAIEAAEPAVVTAEPSEEATRPQDQDSKQGDDSEVVGKEPSTSSDKAELSGSVAEKTAEQGDDPSRRLAEPSLAAEVQAENAQPTPAPDAKVDEPSNAVSVEEKSLPDPTAREDTEKSFAIQPQEDKENLRPEASSAGNEQDDLIKALGLVTSFNDSVAAPKSPADTVVPVTEPLPVTSSPPPLAASPSQDTKVQTLRKPDPLTRQESTTSDRKPSPLDNSLNRTRRAIDISRPNDFSPSPTPPTTAVKKKRGMSIKSFGLGKDKDKVASPSSPGFRHQRTISQILREADAALSIDDDYGLDEYDDDKIFGK